MTPRFRPRSKLLRRKEKFETRAKKKIRAAAAAYAADDDNTVE
jgi:hypothetical protein